MSQAFNGSAAEKKRLLSQLEQGWQNGLIRADGAFWQGESGTFSGCAVRGGLDDYVSVTGLPASLALLADRLAFDEERFDIDWARCLFTVIAPGADLSDIAPRLLAWLLSTTRARLAPWRESIAPDILILFDRLTVLHQARPAAAGSEADWLSVRQAVLGLEADDGTDDGAFSHSLITLLEALCWPLDESVCLFCELLPGLQSLDYLLAKRQSGWGPQWQQREATINQQFDQALAQRSAGEQDAGRLERLRGEIVRELIADHPDYFALIQQTERQIREDRQRLKTHLITLLDSRQQGENRIGHSPDLH